MPPESSTPPPKIRFKHRVEYRLLAALAALANALPYHAALALAAALARFLFHIVRFRRRETLRRIRLVFPDISPRRARRIAYLSLRNISFNLVEMLRIRSLDLADMERLIPNLHESVDRIRALQRGDAALEVPSPKSKVPSPKSQVQSPKSKVPSPKSQVNEDDQNGQTENGKRETGEDSSAANGVRRGIVLALPHMGNWDLAGNACSLCGVPVFSVAGKQRNPLVNDLLNRLREGRGMAIVERGGRTIVQIISRLREGGVFAILPDSRNRLPDIQVPFLGGTANLARGMATFAHSTHSPILPLHMLRHGWGRFEFVMGDPVFPDPALDKADDVRRMTEIVIARVDEAIHTYPEQWFWYNKRWVLDPVEEERT